ncbi:MAG TPA: amino acid deaminase [Dongiaceae bacterium]|jgi:D-serine dehydratase|nr:amino acid deaminase [Dongiaceae bacterium]
MDGNGNPALAALDATMIDGSVKGYPPAAAPAPLGAIGKQGWNLLRQDLPFPVAVLKTSALDHNSRWMDRFRREQGLDLCPHGKTTMSPHLFQRQLADGAWGITVANAQQLRIAREFGVGRIVMANQLIDPQGTRYVLAELKRDPDFDFYCLVDSVAGVRFLADAVKASGLGRPLQVLLEGGIAGGRTGCRTIEEAAAVAAAIRAAAPSLALRGVEGFEGLIHDERADDRASKVRLFLDFLGAIARRGIAEQWFAAGGIVVTAGGSAEFDLVAESWRSGDFGVPVRIVLRSGCYLTHDSGIYEHYLHDVAARGIASDELAADLPRHALEVWALVQSVPEPGLALVTMGKRDVGFDSGLPVPVSWYRPGAAAPQPVPDGHAIAGLNDQHGYLKCPAGSPLQVGDMVAFGVSHPCTTFDRWQLIHLVDDAYAVTGAIKTFF